MDEAERVAPPPLTQVALREPAPPAAEMTLDEGASPAESPPGATPDRPGEAVAARSGQAPHETRPDRGPAIEPPPAADRPVIAPAAVAAASVDATPTEATRIAPEEAPSPRVGARGVTSTSVAEAPPVALRAGVSEGVATTRLASTPPDAAAGEVADADEAAAVWPLATSSRQMRSTRRHGPAAPPSEPVVVEVTIGRVEIRAVPDPAPAVQRTSAAPPLSDYLRDRARTDGVRR